MARRPRGRRNRLVRRAARAIVVKALAAALGALAGWLWGLLRGVIG